jgi:hypothetical protein
MLALVLLAACGNSNPAPKTTSATTAATSASTSAATSPPTSAATSPPTSPPTSAATSGPTASGGGASAACAALDRLDASLTALVPDYHEMNAAAARVIQVSSTLSDQGQATLLAVIGTDAQNGAQAFLAGDLDQGAKFLNHAAHTIPPAKVALGCT